MIDFLEWRLKKIREQEGNKLIQERIDRIIGSTRRLAQLHEDLKEQYEDDRR